MKYFYIFKDDNNFDEILKDPIVKKTARSKISWNKHLILGFKENIDNGVISYFLLKFGDYVISTDKLFKDYTPKPNIDYQPEKKWMNGKFVDI